MCDHVKKVKLCHVNVTKHCYEHIIGSVTFYQTIQMKL